MYITVFGANGTVGSAVVAEAITRGHHVTAVVRDAARADRVHAAASIGVGDVTVVSDVARLSSGQDVVVGAARPADGHEPELITMTEALLDGVSRVGTRLLLVGGAASLTVPDRPGTIVLDDPRHVAPAYLDIARACVRQLEVCRTHPSADWTYLSPPAFLESGKRTGRYRIGSDELVVDDDGVSRLSVADFAVAVLDELETPKHQRVRFTVAY